MGESGLVCSWVNPFPSYKGLGGGGPLNGKQMVFVLTKLHSLSYLV